MAPAFPADGKHAAARSGGRVRHPGGNTGGGAKRVAKRAGRRCVPPEPFERARRSVVTGVPLQIKKKRWIIVLLGCGHLLAVTACKTAVEPCLKLAALAFLRDHAVDLVQDLVDHNGALSMISRRDVRRRLDGPCVGTCVIMTQVNGLSCAISACLHIATYKTEWAERPDWTKRLSQPRWGAGPPSSRGPDRRERARFEGRDDRR